MIKKALLFLFPLSLPLFGTTYLLEDESIIEGLEISENRLYLKQVWVPQPEIRKFEEIKASGDIYRITLSDGTTLTGTVERKESYILIGSNPVFKDTRKVMKADIIEMKELKRIQIQTYLGYILIGVVEKEDSKALHMTNIYNPEGYILEKGIKRKYENNIGYTLEKYSLGVKDHAYTRPWKHPSYYALFSYTYNFDASLKEYIPSIFGSTLGLMYGADGWLKQKNRKYYVPGIGTFLTTQIARTSTSLYLHSNLTVGVYWRYKLPYSVNLYLGIGPGLIYSRIRDIQISNFINFSQHFSFIAEMRVYRQFGIVIRASQNLVFDSQKTYWYPYFEIGGKYEI